MFAAQISAALIECLKQQKYCKAQIFLFFQFIYQIEIILQIVDRNKKAEIVDFLVFIVDFKVQFISK